MAAYFFDSSALVKRYVTESGTPWISSLCDPTVGHTLYISRVTGAEVIAALARRIRTGSLTGVAAESAMSAFRADFSNVYLVSELTPALVERAMDLAQTHSLRGYDAIQLAAALDVNAERRGYGFPPLTLVSADMDLNEAATVEGVAVENPNDRS